MVQHNHGRGPVQGLGDARYLVQVYLPDVLEKAADLSRQHLRDARYLVLNNAQFLLKGWEVYPEVQAAPTKGVREVTGAIGGEDNRRDMVGLNGADLGNGYLELGQDL